MKVSSPLESWISLTKRNWAVFVDWYAYQKGGRMKIKTQKIMFNQFAANSLDISRTVCRLRRNPLSWKKLWVMKMYTSIWTVVVFFFKLYSNQESQPNYNINWENDVQSNILNIIILSMYLISNTFYKCQSSYIHRNISVNKELLISLS